jgi:hypothetical protein
MRREYPAGSDLSLADVFYISHSGPNPGLENPMRDRQPQLSLGHRVLRLSLTWLIIGALIGLVGVERKGGLTEIVSMLISGMIVLTIPGMLLGVIGGDARGSVVGVCGGLLSCWLAKLIGSVAVQPHVIGVVIIFSGLLGATGFLFVRLFFWKYRMIFRCICWMTDMTTVSAKVSTVADHLHLPQRLAGNSVVHKYPSIATRFR